MLHQIKAHPLNQSKNALAHAQGKHIYLAQADITLSVETYHTLTTLSFEATKLTQPDHSLHAECKF